MTVLFGNAGFQNTAGDVASQPGLSPVGSTMQGNPVAQQEAGAYVPAPQVGGSGQTLNAPLAHDTISRGNVPLNAQPSNLVNAAPGTQSLLALMSTGQVSLNQTLYGSAAFAPASAPAGQLTPPPSVATGPGSSITVASPAVYVGN